MLQETTPNNSQTLCCFYCLCSLFSPWFELSFDASLIYIVATLFQFHLTFKLSIFKKLTLTLNIFSITILTHVEWPLSELLEIKKKLLTRTDSLWSFYSTKIVIENTTDTIPTIWNIEKWNETSLEKSSSLRSTKWYIIWPT